MNIGISSVSGRYCVGWLERLVVAAAFVLASTSTKAEAQNENAQRAIAQLRERMAEHPLFSNLTEDGCHTLSGDARFCPTKDSFSVFGVDQDRQGGYILMSEQQTFGEIRFAVNAVFGKDELKRTSDLWTTKRLLLPSHDLRQIPTTAFMFGIHQALLTHFIDVYKNARVHDVHLAYVKDEKIITLSLRSYQQDDDIKALVSALLLVDDRIEIGPEPR